MEIANLVEAEGAPAEADDLPVEAMAAADSKADNRTLATENTNYNAEAAARTTSGHHQFRCVPSRNKLD